MADDSTNDNTADQSYIAQLQKLQTKSQDSYDKTVLSLSGGALGISFAFVKDVVGTSALAHPTLLLIAWSAWVASLGCTLASFFFAREALNKAETQFRAGQREKLGEVWNRVTWPLNLAGGVSFLVGVGFMTCFSYTALGGARGGNEGCVQAQSRETPAQVCEARCKEAEAQPREARRSSSADTAKENQAIAPKGRP